MHEIIRLDQVDFDFADAPVLQNLTLRIFPGEFIHVIGPNGGGKTTFLKLLMGFIEPKAGTIKVMGKSPKEMQRKIAYVPQTFSFDKLFPISVLEVVVSGRLNKLSWHGRYSEADYAKAMDALEQVHMQEFAKRPIGELSGGQVQRVLIARALASDPQILLLDEPTSCIDPKAQEMIGSILNQLKRKLTMIMVTHDLEHIGENADRIICIHGDASELDESQVCQHFNLGLFSEKEQVNA